MSSPVTESEILAYDQIHSEKINGELSSAQKHQEYFAAGEAIRRLLKMTLGGVPDRETLLDVGSPDHEFLPIANKLGYKAESIRECEGFEAFATQIRQMKTRAGNLSKPGVCSWGVVTMFHSLQRFQDPSSVVDCVYGLLKPGGYWVVEVPNLLHGKQSVKPRFLKSHRCYYTKLSLLAAASACFNTVYVEERKNLFIIFRRAERCSLQLSLPPQEEIGRISMKLEFGGIDLSSSLEKPLQALKRKIPNPLSFIVSRWVGK
ncbi:MAG TPA: methyltransferase domain-containing protein [Pseudomonadales bacterium]|nr:methyltransferase domain-containing protein [Pseudomonadales bacterium]